MSMWRFPEQNMSVASFFACFSVRITGSGSGVYFCNSSSIFSSSFRGVFSMMSETASTYATICKTILVE